MIRHAYDDALVDAAVALAAAEDTTGIIETEDGFYILKLVEEKDGLLEEKLKDLFDLYQWGIVGEKVAEASANAAIEWNEYGKSIDLLTIR
jgi:hypothetical protein